VDDCPHGVFAHACRLGADGSVSKKVDATYRSGPCRVGIKVRNPASIAVQTGAEREWCVKPAPFIARHKIGCACETARELIRRDHQFLDDRPPFLDIGLLPRAETFGGLLRTQKDLKPKVGKPRLYRRIGQNLHSHGVELMSFGVSLDAKSRYQARNESVGSTSRH
jgi:hypothetical protein